MTRLISLVSAALALAACSNPTAPHSADQSAEAAKAKTALGAVAKGGIGQGGGNARLASN